ncbi:hypothetical protein BGW39_001390, partial [Mortierella sp. 14UC]
MSNQNNHPHLQAVRLINQDRSLPEDNIYLVCHSDPSTGRDIVLWDDVPAAFKEDIVFHIRSGAVVLPFLKGLGFD